MKCLILLFNVCLLSSLALANYTASAGAAETDCYFLRARIEALDASKQKITQLHNQLKQSNEVLSCIGEVEALGGKEIFS